MGVWLALTGGGRAEAQSVLSFHAPAQPSGSMDVRLHPMENVTPGTPTLVTFGVPFTRGSMTVAGLSTVRVLQGGVEVPAHVELLTPWRHLTSAAVDGQSVRVARVQIRHAFVSGYPESETLTVAWGGAPRSMDVPGLTDPLQGWHPVTSGTFEAADGIREPDVYVVLPKEVLALGVLNGKRHAPFGGGIVETRDDPAAEDAVEQWPGYEEVDRAFKNSFYTTINQDDPRVTQYGAGMLIDYKHDSEPWLYDRSSAFFLLYLKSGYLRPLREAVRSTQYYRTQLYGPEVLPPTSAGLFKLKTPNPATPSGGNDAMYAYAECFAYDLWLTGNPESVEPIRWVAATVNALADNSRWGPTLGAWTERHTSLATLANVVAFEVTGDALYRETVLRHVEDYRWHQDGAGGLLPANRLDGGLYHYGWQHGDGEPDVLVASHWMTTLTVDAMVRAYGVSEDPGIADFVIRAARFQASALMEDDEHDFDTYAGVLRYPGYMIRYDGAPDLLDGHDTSAINHALDVASSVAWGAYFQHLRHGVPDPGIEAAARDLYFAFDVGVNFWIRPAAPPLGFTAFRVNPPRKFSWEHRPSGSLSWVMGQIDAISPPPQVVITAPAPNTRYTAPATVQIEVEATAPNASIVKVEFFDGAVKIGEDDTAPYTLTWTGVIADTRGHTLTAKATTSLGVVGASLGVPIDVRAPGRPELTLVSPAPGTTLTAPAEVVLVAEVVPEPGVAVDRVVFLREYIEQHVDREPPYTFTVAGVLAGSHEFEVMAFDVNGGYDIETVRVTVRTPTPPTVALTSPTAGTQVAREGILRLRADASAAGSRITRVRFLADGGFLAEDSTAPYEIDYRVSAGWELGAHTITARAYETNGGIAESTTSIEAIGLPPMTATWVSPAASANIPFPTPIEMEVEASAPDSEVASVEFFANGQPAGSMAAPPYRVTFVPESIRDWELRARVTDTYGRRVEVARLVHVTGPSTPTVAFVAPVGGALGLAPATFALEAVAAVSGATIVRVEFYRGSTRLGEDAEAPFTWTDSDVGVGEYLYRAVAVASTGRTAEASVRVMVGAPDAPVATVTAPRFSGPQVGTFERLTFEASAGHTGAGSIERVEFWLDNVRLGEDRTAPYALEWVVGSNYGYHEVQARAFDTTGVEGRSGTVGFELIQPPTVAVGAPAAGATVGVGRSSVLSATVVRGTYAISEVRFLVNGAVVGTDATAPYAYDWTPATPGTYRLSARVYDTRGLSPSSPEVVVTAATNLPPSAAADEVARAEDRREAKVATSVLLANDSDPDGDTLSLTAVGNAQPAGATVTVSGAWVIYTAPAAGAGNGSFEYTLSDGPGGHAVTGLVTVVSSVPGGGGPNAATLELRGSDVVVTFVGVPGRAYRVQYATDLTPPAVWQEFGPPAVSTAAPNGVFGYVDVAPAGPQRFYRAVTHP